MATEISGDREHQFRDLLLSISRQLKKQDVQDLSYLVEIPDVDTALELLKEIRNKGLFSPFHCSPFADLLKKIQRHDLADEVTNKYVIVHPDQSSPPLGRTQREHARQRSATNPSTSSIEDFSSFTEKGPASFPTTFTCKKRESCASLENVGDFGLNHQGFTRFAVSRSSTSSRLSHCSQCSSIASSCSSCKSSESSLTEEVLERASRMLLQDVKANYSNQSRTLPSPGPPTSLSPQPPSAQTLPPRIIPPPDYSETIASTDGTPDIIQHPTISEIMSDEEEEELDERRGTLECPIAAASRRKQTKELAIPGLVESIEQSQTPRASMVVTDDPDFESTLNAASASSSSESQADVIEDDKIEYQKTNPPQNTIKEDLYPSSPPLHLPASSRRWKKYLHQFINRSKMKQSQGEDVVLWKVQREELGRPIWNHDTKCCITRSTKYDLDTHLGRYNPKLQFQLYPYGSSEDCGESMTMIVRIQTSDKTPPLPGSATVTIILSVYDERDGEKHSLNICTTHKPLDLGYFSIRRVVTHDALRKSKSKYIHFEMKITCGGVDLESFGRKRVPTH